MAECLHWFGSSPTADLLILFFLILFYFLFLYFYYILFISLFCIHYYFFILLGMDPKCLLASTDLQTRRARCQHQLSFLFSYVEGIIDISILRLTGAANDMNEGIHG